MHMSVELYDSITNTLGIVGINVAIGNKYCCQEIITSDTGLNICIHGYSKHNHIFVKFKASIVYISAVIDINVTKREHILLPNNEVLKRTKLFVQTFTEHKCTCLKYELSITYVLGIFEVNVAKRELTLHLGY